MRSISFVRTESDGDFEAAALLAEPLDAPSDFAGCGSFEARVASSNAANSTAIAVSTIRKRLALIILKLRFGDQLIFSTREQRRHAAGRKKFARRAVDFLNRDRLDPGAEDETFRSRQRNVSMRRCSAD